MHTQQVCQNWKKQKIVTWTGTVTASLCSHSVCVLLGVWLGHQSAKQIPKCCGKYDLYLWIEDQRAFGLEFVRWTYRTWTAQWHPQIPPVAQFSSGHVCPYSKRRPGTGRAPEWYACWGCSSERVPCSTKRVPIYQTFLWQAPHFSGHTNLNTSTNQHESTIFRAATIAALFPPQKLFSLDDTNARIMGSFIPSDSSIAFFGGASALYLIHPGILITTNEGNQRLIWNIHYGSWW